MDKKLTVRLWGHEIELCPGCFEKLRKAQHAYARRYHKTANMPLKRSASYWKAKGVTDPAPPPHPPDGWIQAGEVQRRLFRSKSWVYRYRYELGGRKIGEGKGLFIYPEELNFKTK